jgi:hypothetical protein
MKRKSEKQLYLTAAIDKIHTKYYWVDDRNEKESFILCNGGLSF